MIRSGEMLEFRIHHNLSGGPVPTSAGVRQAFQPESAVVSTQHSDDSAPHVSLSGARVSLARRACGLARDLDAIHSDISRRDDSEPGSFPFDGDERYLGFDRRNHDPLSYFATENEHESSSLKKIRRGLVTL